MGCREGLIDPDVAVFAVTEDGMTGCGQLCADLVRTSCDEVHPQQGEPFFQRGSGNRFQFRRQRAGERLIRQTRRIGGLILCVVLLQVQGRGKTAAYNAPVVFSDQPLTQQRSQQLLAGERFPRGNEAAGVSVQAVSVPAEKVSAPVFFPAR